MKLNIKSLFLTVVIVGGFIDLYSPADQAPGMGSFPGGKVFGSQSTWNPKGPEWGEPPLRKKIKSDSKATAQLTFDQGSTANKLARN